MGDRTRGHRFKIKIWGCAITWIYLDNVEGGMCEDSDTLTLTFSDRFVNPLELLQAQWIDGIEHADHDSGIYFTLHITIWQLESNIFFGC